MSESERGDAERFRAGADPTQVITAQAILYLTNQSEASILLQGETTDQSVELTNSLLSHNINVCLHFRFPFHYLRNIM